MSPAVSPASKPCAGRLDRDRGAKRGSADLLPHRSHVAQRGLIGLTDIVSLWCGASHESEPRRVNSLGAFWRFVERRNCVLKDMILSGELSEGERLPSERDLAIRLGVARSSVREAIRELVAIGVLVTRRGAGTYVANLVPDRLFAAMEFALRIHPDSILDVLQLRLLLEPSVAALAANRATVDQLTELNAALDRYRAGVNNQHDFEAIVEADEHLHDLLLDMQPNVLLRAVIRSLRQAAHASRVFTVKIRGRGDLAESMAELESLVGAVARHDQIGAEAAMTRHLSRTLQSAQLELSMSH